MEFTLELLKCVNTFLILAKTIALCVLQHLRNKTTTK